MYPKRVSDDEIVETYRKTGSVWKTGDALGICGQSAHERLVKLGEVKKVNVFTDAERERLMNEYLIYRDAGKLQELADDMGRTKQFICRKAGELGLTDQRHKRPYQAKWENVPDDVLREIIMSISRSRKTLTEYMKEHGYGVGFEQEAARRLPAEWEAMTELKRSNKPNMYRRGRDFEYQTKREMEKHGYVVMRSPASKSPADLMAVRDGRAVFVQCKLHGALPPSEWNGFIDYAEKAGCLPLMACRVEGERGIKFYKLLCKKDGSKKRQPMELYDISKR